MAVVNPFVSLRDWRTSLYRGDEARVDRFLNLIDSSFPSGWVRDRAYELTRSRPDRIRCYLFDSPGDAAVRVWLQRVTATRVRGGPVQLIRHPASGDAKRIEELVSRFVDDCVQPAVSRSGVCSTRPAFGLRSTLTSAAEMLFTRLADKADGEWPLEERTQEVWDELVSNCLADHVAIDRAELEGWFADSGWEPSVVRSLVNRFFADAEWLALRLAALAP